jgi:hypothetical protein
MTQAEQRNGARAGGKESEHARGVVLLLKVSWHRTIADGRAAT